MKKSTRIMLVSICVLLVAVVSGYIWYSGRYDRYMQEGNENMNRKLYGEALDAFASAVDAKPGSVEAVLAMARAYQAKQDDANARMYYQKVIEMDGGITEAYLYLASQLLQEDQVSEAVEVLKEGSDQTQDSDIQSLLEKLTEVPQSPVPDVKPGAYNEAKAIVFSSETPDVKIYYTTDGSVPTTASALAEGPVKLGEGKTKIQAIAVSKAQISSEVTICEYEIHLPIQFEDKAFEQYIRQLIGKQEGIITSQDTQKITSITIYGDTLITQDRIQYDEYKNSVGYKAENGKVYRSHEYNKKGGITTLKDLKWFPGLVELSLRHQSITTVEGLENLNSIRYIDLSYNDITDIQGINALQGDLLVLDLSNNKIRDVSVFFSFSKTIRNTLMLQGNPIEDTTPLKNVRAAQTIL